MDCVTVEQREIIKKTSSDRLRSRLEQAEWSAADISELNREQLMEAVAELYVDPDISEAMASVDMPSAESVKAKEVALREREIALREMELRERLAERLAQEKRWEEEMELRRAEYKRLQKIDAEKAEQESSLADRTKKFADSVKYVFIKMSDDPAELPMFFAAVENL